MIVVSSTEKIFIILNIDTFVAEVSFLVSQKSYLICSDAHSHALHQI